MFSSIFSRIGAAFTSSVREQEIKSATREYLDEIAQAPSGLLAFRVEQNNYTLTEISIYPGPDLPSEFQSSFPEFEQVTAPSESRMNLWEQVSLTLNNVFENYKIPIHYTVKGPSNSSLVTTQEGKTVVFDGASSKVAGASSGNWIAIKTGIDSAPRTMTHELGHSLDLPHPHDKHPIRALQPDLAQLICEGAAGIEPSAMAYSTECAAAGYFPQEFG